MKKLIPILLLLCAQVCRGQIVAVDDTDGQPVPRAQVMGRGGIVIGLTGDDGRLPEACLKEGEVSLQHLAYETLTFSPKDITTGEVRMRPATYEVAEVAVNVSKPEVACLRAYFRCYQMNDSALKYFEDGIVDYYVPLSGGLLSMTKTKKLADRFYADREAVASDGKRNIDIAFMVVAEPDLSNSLLINEFADEVDLSQPISATKLDGRLHTLYHKQGETCFMQTDRLTGGKKHELDLSFLKLLGYHFTITQNLESQTYTVREDGRYGLSSLRAVQNALGGRYKYKGHAEQHIDVNYEVFVTECEYLTKKEAKARRKSEAAVSEVSVPDHVPALSPEIQAMLRNMQEVESDVKEE